LSFNLSKTLNIYLLKESIRYLLISTVFFISIISLATLVEELNFAKVNTGITFKILIFLILASIPNQLSQILPFVFLVGGILFFINLFNKNEILPIKTTGYSNLKILMIPSIFSLLTGYFLIFFFITFSSSLYKNYINIKSFYDQKKNFIFFQENGIWLIDIKLSNEKNFIHIESIEPDFLKAKNISIYEMDINNNLKRRIDAEEITFEKKNWKLSRVRLFNVKESKISNIKNYEYTSSFESIDLRKIFRNPEVLSIFEIKNEIIKLKNKGYSPIEYDIYFQKLLSFPIYFSLMTMLAGILTINLGRTSNYYLYTFIAICLSILLYFLNNLSITFAKAGIISFEISVWLPIFLITLFNATGIIQINAK